ncbi:hypothetical protein [Planomicrobium sp. YIM 101495]|uniref:hypothetical protein n=1 Tax=Planomicrobium sp. YIM 101495 TaxID=2665160 RepID=UPI0012B7394F|nr:hypothetical protein [Planomicrobium sp. YIM 101495]MTD30674.1 hypothetical protein [Planomicrobium sp. YIM 101495]
MKQRIGNVGVLNLLNATEESVQGYEKIGNVGVVLYRTGQSGLLASLNIGNVGKTIEVPDGYSYFNGILTIDAAYVSSLTKQLKMVVNGTVILANDLTAEQLETENMDFIINGTIYVPAHLTGMVSQLFSEGSRSVHTYEDTPPRFENGAVELSNSYLRAAKGPLHLVVNGTLTLPQDLDMELFNQKISDIEVNGLVTVHAEQEESLHAKMSSAPNGVVQVIPAGYLPLRKSLKLNSRSIRSLKKAKLLTKKPLILEKDLSREAFDAAISRINSKSFIVCHEEIEDLVYEKLDRLETEVLSFDDRFVLIEGDETWTKSRFESFAEPLTLIVNGLLTISSDVTEETVQNSLSSIDLLGEIQVMEPKLFGAVQAKIRANSGELKEQTTEEVNPAAAMQNIGELSL